MARVQRFLILAIGVGVLAAALPARAATVTIQWQGCVYYWCYVDAQAHRFKQAAPGDTIEWIWRGDHNVVFYDGDVTVGNNSTCLSGGAEQPCTSAPVFKVPFKKTFAGGDVYFRCTRGSNSQLSGDGKSCSGMCGGYTSRTSAPGTPAITNLIEGATTGTGFQLEGTAEPFVDIGTNAGSGARSDRFGNWEMTVFRSAGPVQIEVWAQDMLKRRSASTTLTLNVVGPTPSLPYPDPGGSAVMSGLRVVASVGDRLHLEGTAARAGGLPSGVYVKVWDAIGNRLKTLLANCPTCSYLVDSAAWSIDIPTGALVGSLQPGVYIIESLFWGQTSGDRVTAIVVSASDADKAQAPVPL